MFCFETPSKPLQNKRVGGRRPLGEGQANPRRRGSEVAFLLGEVGFLGGEVCDICEARPLLKSVPSTVIVRT